MMLLWRIYGCISIFLFGAVVGHLTCFFQFFKGKEADE